jgi:hypothetical protein
MVTGHDRLVSLMENDAKDRHIVAAAVQSHSEVIVTFNLKHFPKEKLEKHGVCAQHPSDFLINLYTVDPGIFITKLAGIAENREIPIGRVVHTLSKFLPDLTDFLSESAGLS